MKSILTKDEIRETCLANGFSLKKQPNGEMDLNPYVYNAAAALVERGLQATLVSNRRSLQSVVEKGPGAALVAYSYTEMGPMFVKDHRKLWAAVERLQGSLVLRHISSTNLYNAVVVDKHDTPIAAALNKTLGVAMSELIQQTRDLLLKAESVPNQPFFEETLDDVTQKLKTHCAEQNVNLELPSENDHRVRLDHVRIDAGSALDSAKVALTVATSSLNANPSLEREPVKADFGFERGQYYITPVFGYYPSFSSAEWADDWHHMLALADFCGIKIEIEESGEFATVYTVKVANVTFSSLTASCSMRHANCYLGWLVLKAASTEKKNG